jgi:hypothetical protein
VELCADRFPKFLDGYTRKRLAETAALSGVMCMVHQAWNL